MNYAKGKINLAQFEHAIMDIPSEDGNKIECVVMPIEKNNIFKSEKGNLFVDFGTKEKPENFKGEFTHFMKQSVSKSKYQEMKEKGVYPPDFGTMTIVCNDGESKPNVASYLSPNPEIKPDNLPF